MKVTLKRRAANWEVIITAENHEEDQIAEDIFNSGSVLAMGETAQEHKELILTTGIPPR